MDSPPERLEPVTAVSLEDLAFEWLIDLARTRRDATVESYGYSVQMFLSVLESRVRTKPTLSHFTDAALKAFDDDNRRDGASPWTRRTRAAPLKKWAQWLELRHPDHFRAGPIRAVELPKAPRGKALALTWAEIDAVISNIGGHSKVAAMIARCTGMRRETAVSLVWGDLVEGLGGDDRPPGMIRIRDEITKGGRSGRLIPVPQALWQFLMHRRATCSGDLSDRITPVSKDAFGSGVAKALKAAVAQKMCRPEVLSVRSTTHLLRKSFMTNLHRKGVAMEVLDAILGHSIGVNDAYLDLEEQMWAAMRLVPQYEPPKRPELAVVSKG